MRFNAVEEIEYGIQPELSWMKMRMLTSRVRPGNQVNQRVQTPQSCMSELLPVSHATGEWTHDPKGMCRATVRNFAGVQWIKREKRAKSERFVANAGEQITNERRGE